MSSSRIKVWTWATCEAGYDMAQFGARRVMVVSDPNLTCSEPVTIVLEALRAQGLDAVLYDGVHIEPTTVHSATRSDSQRRAASMVRCDRRGSTMDTPRWPNLYATYPADFLAYVERADRSSSARCRDGSSR